MSARLGGWKKSGRWAKRMSCGESSRDHRCIEDGRSAKFADPLPQRLICKLFLRSLLSEQLPDKETKMRVAVGLFASLLFVPILLDAFPLVLRDRVAWPVQHQPQSHRIRAGLDVNRFSRHGAVWRIDECGMQTVLRATE